MTKRRVVVNNIEEFKQTVKDKFISDINIFYIPNEVLEWLN